jgi:hypothetical protein
MSRMTNNTTVHRLVQSIRDAVFICNKCSLGNKKDEFTVVSISSSASAAKTGHGSKNSILWLVSSFARDSVRM